MNKKNFLQKYFIEIMVILLLGIVIIIMIHKNHHGTSQAQSPLSSWDSEKETLESEENEIENPFSNRPKRSAKEQPIPKIKTTAARLEQIKNYLFTEPINSTLLPTDLLEREQEEINELKKSWQKSLDLLKEQKTWIDEKQNKCDEYQSQLNRIPSEIKSWENKKTPLEIQLETKEKELNRLKIDRELNRLKIDRKANETQIKKLQEEILEIV
ncbi:MAG: effector, partial [Candidatus Phytoplasma stylosanthis]|uniref:effector n=1 Tax=Candidatus Phytoplasma stylosanthis TaxID=2798314 RepID=UPI002939C287